MTWIRRVTCNSEIYIFIAYKLGHAHQLDLYTPVLIGTL